MNTGSELGGTVQPVEVGSDVTRDPRPAELHTTTWLLKRMRQMKSALQECESYFEERADAEYFTDSPDPCGNAEMRILMEVRAAIEGLPADFNWLSAPSRAQDDAWEFFNRYVIPVIFAFPLVGFVFFLWLIGGWPW